jgi:hypothetical protein
VIIIHHRVRSSADIPEQQQWDKVKPVALRSLIASTVQHGVPLPPEIITYILKLAKWGFSKEEANAHREALMQERKYYVDANNRQWQRSFSFCEH